MSLNASDEPYRDVNIEIAGFTGKIPTVEKASSGEYRMAEADHLGE